MHGQAMRREWPLGSLDFALLGAVRPAAGRRLPDGRARRPALRSGASAGVAGRAHALAGCFARSPAHCFRIGTRGAIQTSLGTVGQGVDSENLLRWPAPGRGATGRRAAPAGMCSCCSFRLPFTLSPIYARGVKTRGTPCRLRQGVDGASRHKDKRYRLDLRPM